MATRTQGYILVTLSAVFYSSLGVFARYIYDAGMDMTLVTLLRFLATVIVLGFFWLFDRKRPLLTHSPSVLLQGVFFVGAAIFYLFAVKNLSAGLATVIMFAHPALVALLAAIVYHEKIVRQHAVALVLALLGLLFISGLLAKESKQLAPGGLVLAILCAVMYGFYALSGQHTIKKDSVWTITFTLALMGLLISAAIFPGSVPKLMTITPYQAVFGLGMAFFSTILPIVLFLKGIRTIGASTGSLIGMSEIPFSLMLAYVVLGETVTPMQILGSALIGIAAVVAMARRARWPWEARGRVQP